MFILKILNCKIEEKDFDYFDKYDISDQLYTYGNLPKYSIILDRKGLSKNIKSYYIIGASIDSVLLPKFLICNELNFNFDYSSSPRFKFELDKIGTSYIINNIESMLFTEECIGSFPKNTSSVNVLATYDIKNLKNIKSKSRLTTYQYNYNND